LDDQTRKRFCDLYRNYKFYIHKRLLYLLGDEEQAREMTQEVFFKVVVELEKGNREVLNIRYLTRMATNQCIDQLRRTGAHPQVPIDAEWLGSVLGRDDRVRVDQMVLVHQMLGRLPRALRAIAVYRLVDGYGLDEIAAITGIPVRTLQRKLIKLKKRLRAWLS
jgi:RNA polymerase sigma-70 factor (ECF subfamily)